MNTEKVSILGHELEVTFNMAVQIGFEEASGLPFSIEGLNTQKATMQVCYEVLKEANGTLPFTFDEMTKKISVKETADLKNATMKAMYEWFDIPKVMIEEEAPADKEDDGKNA
jgi:hypothetical protein